MSNFRARFERELAQIRARIAEMIDATSDVAQALRPRAAAIDTLLVEAAHHYATVDARLDDEQPDVGHPLVASAMPALLRPAPAATVARCTPALDAAEWASIDAGTALSASHPRAGDCRFETVAPIEVPPFEVTDVALIARSHDARALRIGIAATQAARAVRLREGLTFFVSLDDARDALELAEALADGEGGIVIERFDAEGRPLGRTALPHVRLTRVSPAPLLPLGTLRPDDFPASDALRALFVMPELFCFLSLAADGETFAAVAAPRLVLEVPLRKGFSPKLTSTRPPLHVGCGVATNVRVGAGIERADDPAGRWLSIGAQSDAHELTELHGGWVRADGGRPETPLVDWERSADALSPSELPMYRLRRRVDPIDSTLKVDVSFVRDDDPYVRPPGTLRWRVSYSDGPRASSIGQGALSAAGGRLTNIRPVAPHIPALFDREIIWRMNAYARMGLPALANVESLSAFCALHDLPRLWLASRDECLAARTAGISLVRAEATHRVDGGGDLELGFAVRLELSSHALGGVGRARLLGELLIDALTERIDMLRFVRPTLVIDGRARQLPDRLGLRLPPPWS